jgi:hypothetical protein
MLYELTNQSAAKISHNLQYMSNASSITWSQDRHGSMAVRLIRSFKTSRWQHAMPDLESKHYQEMAMMAILSEAGFGVASYKYSSQESE